MFTFICDLCGVKYSSNLQHHILQWQIDHEAGIPHQTKMAGKKNG